MQRFPDQSAIFPILSISLGLAAVSVFGSLPIAQVAQADERLGFIAAISSSSARATLAEPEPTVLTQKNQDEFLTSRTIPTAFADVQTQGDVEAYAASLIHEDEGVMRIELSPKRITMTYRSQEEVAGFGLRYIERTITVTDEGYVFVNRPWYTQDGGSTVAAESGFNDLVLQRTAEGFTAEAQARLLTRMQGRFAIGAL